MIGELVTVDRAFIESGGTPTGRAGCYAWTNAQHKILGTFPPRRGWMEKAIGRKITPEAADAFLTIARRPKGLSRKAKHQRNTALRQVAWTLQGPLDDGAKYADPDNYRAEVAAQDAACPICRGDDLGRLNCPLCSAAIMAPADPWLELERIARDISLNTTTTAQLAVTRAAKALHRPGLSVSREIFVMARFVRALDAAMQCEEAKAA